MKNERGRKFRRKQNLVVLNHLLVKEASHKGFGKAKRHLPNSYVGVQCHKLVFRSFTDTEANGCSATVVMMVCENFFIESIDYN